MDFKNRLKGGVTQILISSLLKDASYRIVPLGVEEVVRDVQSLNTEEFRRLGLTKTLRTLPDFLVTSASMDATWLLEVKFRKRWNEETRAALGAQLLEQAKYWQPLHLLVALGTPARTSDTPASYMGIIPLTVRDGVLGTLSVR